MAGCAVPNRAFFGAWTALPVTAFRQAVRPRSPGLGASEDRSRLTGTNPSRCGRCGVRLRDAQGRRRCLTGACVL